MKGQVSGLLRTVIFLCLFFYVGPSNAGSGDEFELVNEFRDFRMAINQSDDSALLKYFSRRVLESSLHSLIQSSSESWEHNVNAIKSQFAAAKHVNFVYKYEIIQESSEEFRLEIVYKADQQGEPYKIGFTYVVSGCTPLIDKVTYYGKKEEFASGLEVIEQF